MRAKNTEHIAIVGGGIAGAGAAWSLHRAGYQVSLFEAGPELGGNARTYDWELGETTLQSPLLVFAWPEQYYHNYKALLGELGVGTRPMPNAYFVSSPDGAFAQDDGGALRKKFGRDFARWDRVVRFVDWVNGVFLPKSRDESLYHSSYLNPMNLIPLYWLARAFGVSAKFWRTIFVGLHCATFITSRMKRIPAVTVSYTHLTLPTTPYV